MNPQSQYISYEVPQTKPRIPELKDQSAKLKEYIRDHALKYAGPEPKLSDPDYTKWYNKLIKYEELVYKKYMTKLLETQQSAQPVQPQQGSPVPIRINMAHSNGSHGQRQSVSPIPSPTGTPFNAAGPANFDIAAVNHLQCHYNDLQQKYNQLLMEQQSVQMIQAKMAELEKFSAIISHERSKDAVINELKSQLLEINNINLIVTAQNDEYEQEKLEMQSEQIIVEGKYKDLQSKYNDMIQRDELKDFKIKSLEDQNRRLMMRLRMMEKSNSSSGGSSDEGLERDFTNLLNIDLSEV